jgi:hypothetical protein
MNRQPPRKTTNVQAEAPAAEAPVPPAPVVAPAGPPPLSAGWKVALTVWALGFFGLAAYEVANLVWRLVVG